MPLRAGTMPCMETPVLNAKTDPVEIARVALRGLITKGLAPTPENYAHEYRGAAGLPPSSLPTPEAGVPDPATMQQIESLLAQVSETSAGLASGVDRFHVDTGPLLAEIGTTPTKEYPFRRPALTRASASRWRWRWRAMARRPSVGESRRGLRRGRDGHRRGSLPACR